MTGALSGLLPACREGVANAGGLLCYWDSGFSDGCSASKRLIRYSPPYSRGWNPGCRNAGLMATPRVFARVAPVQACPSWI